MTQTILSGSRFGWVLIVLAAMTWGLDLLFRSPMTAAGLNPTLIVFGEHLLLTVAFIPTLILSQLAYRSLSAQQWTILVFLAWGSSAFATWLYTLAFVYGSPLAAILLQKTQPIFALILAPIFLGEKRKAYFWPLAAVALVGAYLLALGWISPLTALEQSHWKPALLAVGASALWGAGTIAGRALSSVLSPAALSAGRFAIALPALGVALAFNPTAMSNIHKMTPQLGVDWICLAALPGLLGMLLYYNGIRSTSASVATLAELAYPTTAIIAGYFLLHQKLGVVQLTGLVILLIAIQRLAVSKSVEPLRPAVDVRTALGEQM